MMREDFIHYHMRTGLKNLDWTLIAGQYPDGSDDELRTMYVVDPAVARDRSPQPRHHSLNKQVPDLVAYRDDMLLVVEAKPNYDLADEKKLLNLMSIRREDFNRAAVPLLIQMGIDRQAKDLTLVPALAFRADIVYTPHPLFAYIEIDPTGTMTYKAPQVVTND